MHIGKLYQTIKKKYVFIDCLVFFSVVLWHIFLYFKGGSISLISDQIGQLAITTWLSGNDWKDLISETSYYGWGFNWIFGALFRLTSNPYTIDLIIKIILSLVVAVGSLCIFKTIHILDNNREENSLLFAIISIIAGVSTPTGYGSTGTVFTIVGVIAYTFVNAANQEILLKKRIALQILLGFELIYAISLHERNVIFLGAFFVMIFTFWIVCIDNKAVFLRELIPCLSAILLIGIIFIVLKKIIILNIWSYDSSDGAIKNSTIIRGNFIWFLDDLWKSFTLFMSCILSNIYTYCNNTYGIGSISIVVFFKVLIGDLFLKKKISKNSILEMLIIWLGLTILLIICGLSFDGARGVYKGNYNNYVNWMYPRYYISYSYLLVGLSVIYILKDVVNRTKIVAWSFLIYLISGLYFAYRMIPILENSQEYATRIIKIYLAWLLDFGDNILNIKISFLIVFIVLMLIIKDKKNYIGVFILTMAVILSWNTSPLSQIKCYSCGALYDFYSQNGIDYFPQDIYTVSNSRYTLQYMINRKTIRYGMPPDELNQAVFFSNSQNKELQDDYVEIELDNNEWIYLKGIDLEIE